MIRLEQLRIDAALTRSALAAKSDVSEDTIRAIEEGTGTPRVATLVKLGVALGVKPSTLLAPAVFDLPEPEDLVA